MIVKWKARERKKMKRKTKGGIDYRGEEAYIKQKKTKEMGMLVG